MKKVSGVIKTTNNSRVYKAYVKEARARKGLIKCRMCPYHKMENK